MVFGASKQVTTIVTTRRVRVYPVCIPKIARFRQKRRNIQRK